MPFPSVVATALISRAGNIDGVTTTLTARLADHFHNPVPDGTAVSFTSEGGSVLPGCITVGGACNSVLTSQALRPSNGRVTVLARATGEEAFIDLNGNGTVDGINEMIDAIGLPTDMPEAFVDYNENGIRDANEPFFDFNGNGVFDGPDAKYNGVLCTAGAAICSTQKSIDVRDSAVVVFSTSSAFIVINDGQTINLPPCTIAGGAGRTPDVHCHGGRSQWQRHACRDDDSLFHVQRDDYLRPPRVIVPNTNGCRTGFAGCPASAGSPSFGDFLVTMKSDGVFAAGDPNQSADGGNLHEHQRQRRNFYGQRNDTRLRNYRRPHYHQFRGCHRLGVRRT